MVKAPFIKLIASAALLGLAACSTPSEHLNMADGTQGYRITCGGAISSKSDCFEKAGALCGNKGYTVIRETDIAPPSDANYFWNAAAHEVLMKCNNGGR